METTNGVGGFAVAVHCCVPEDEAVKLGDVLTRSFRGTEMNGRGRWGWAVALQPYIDNPISRLTLTCIFPLNGIKPL